MRNARRGWPVAGGAGVTCLVTEPAVPCGQFAPAGESPLPPFWWYGRLGPGVPVRNVSPAPNEREQGFRRQVADDFVVALMGADEGQARGAGTDPPDTLLARPGTGASLPTVTARRSCDTRYPPNCE